MSVQALIDTLDGIDLMPLREQHRVAIELAIRAIQLDPYKRPLVQDAAWELLDALNKTVAELQRIRYSREVCPGCNHQPHAFQCPLVAVLDTAASAIRKATQPASPLPERRCPCCGEDMNGITHSKSECNVSAPAAAGPQGPPMPPAQKGA